MLPSVSVGRDGMLPSVSVGRDGVSPSVNIRHATGAPSLIEKVKQAHIWRFGVSPAVVAYAPGRVEILGNHTDYNEGFVLSAAIDLGIAMAASSSPTRQCALQAMDVKEEAAFEMPVKTPLEKPLWANYVLGVASKLSAFTRMEKGFWVTFSGNIPIGAGLSSSAALEVASALGLSALYGINLPKIEMAKMCQAAENEFTGARCGLLDQISSLYGEPDALVFTDFRSLDVSSVPLGADVRFLIANTRIKHSLVESEYNERRARCEQAAAFFASVLNHPVKALRDVSVEEWNRFAPKMDPVTARRAAHVIEENDRVQEGRKALVEGNLKRFGEWMFQSHRSSRIHFENSCRELDLIVAAARQLPQVFGARLSGGGFGGSVVLMVRPSDAGDVSREIAEQYRAVVGHPCEVRVIKPSAGARLVRK